MVVLASVQFRMEAKGSGISSLVVQVSFQTAALKRDQAEQERFENYEQNIPDVNSVYEARETNFFYCKLRQFNT